MESNYLTRKLPVLTKQFLLKDLNIENAVQPSCLNEIFYP